MSQRVIPFFDIDGAVGYTMNREGHIYEADGTLHGFAAGVGCCLSPSYGAKTTGAPDTIVMLDEAGRVRRVFALSAPNGKGELVYCEVTFRVSTPAKKDSVSYPVCICGGLGCDECRG